MMAGFIGENAVGFRDYSFIRTENADVGGSLDFAPDAFPSEGLCFPPFYFPKAIFFCAKFRMTRRNESNFLNSHLHLRSGISGCARVDLV